MKTPFLLLGVVLFLVPITTSAQDDFFDDFESHTAGIQLCCQSAEGWRTWTGATCGDEDPFVSDDHAYSGSRSMVIIPENDVLRLHDQREEGSWGMSWYMYIPEGKTGYFNVLSGFDPNPAEWALDVYFTAGGDGMIETLGRTWFTWVEDEWQLVELIIDLDHDLAQFWFDGDLILQWEYSLNGMVNGIDATDFYGITEEESEFQPWDNQMYIDDFRWAPDTLRGVHFPEVIRVPADYATIQEGIDAALDGDTVLVDQGTYVENIWFNGKAITVTSHFNEEEPDTTIITNTIIDGSEPPHPDSGAVVTFWAGEDVTSVLSGFTITHGTGTLTASEDVSGGGIVMYAGGTVKNNIIEDNHCTSDRYANGGGIVVDISGGQSVVIENNIIRNNSATGNEWTTGGGIALFDFSYSAYAMVANNKILNNTISDPQNAVGGGVELTGGGDQFFFIGNLISGNEVVSGDAGGMDLYDCTPTLKNNIITENSASVAGGVLFDTWNLPASSPIAPNGRPGRVSGAPRTHPPVASSLSENLFLNNTIANNSASTGGGGIVARLPAPVMQNLIVWGNTAPAAPQIAGVADVRYSDVEGGYDGEGNIGADPQFREGDEYYRVQSYSPCIDSGNPSAIYNDRWDPTNPGHPLPPALGTLRNDMGHCGGPASSWPAWEWPNPVAETPGIVTEFALMNNYPNPFNPSTMIRFSLPRSVEVSLTIYNLLGERVATLASGLREAGTHTVQWDATGQASGVYFYRLTAGTFVETKRLLLLK